MITQRLGDHVSFLSGFAFKSSHFNDSGNGMPVIRIRDVTRGYSETYYSGEYSDRYIIDDGDYLIGMDGEFNLARWTAGKALLNQRVCKIDEVSEDVDRSYLARFLPIALKKIEDSTPFVTVKHLSVKKLNEIQVPLPPLGEQKRIAKILDAADALRAKRRESRTQLDALLQSTFVDLFGDPVRNPKGWDELPLEEIVSDSKIGLVRSSKEFDWGCTIPYVRMDAVSKDGRFLANKVQFTEASQKEIEASSLMPGDFLFNTRNSKELVGKSCIYTGPEGWLFNNNLMRIRFIDSVCPEVVATQFLFSRVSRELEQRKSGTTNVFAVYWKNLKSLPVLVPPKELQVQYAAIVRSVNKQSTQLNQHLDELDRLFSSLKKRAFSGEL
ncbi:restriction endonuclease subunit S [Marinobacter caseinilyticus]|uniref:restriction endonuclease subunit S n=1 Tax=Marinobacter caseinilyticus TaxID=2692195 RepID=UPI00140C679F|nr:restriction endonuclease subunit S [Marinobacter caseinilyticus]